jgi:hypothetical protein
LGDDAETRTVRRLALVLAACAFLLLPAAASAQSLGPFSGTGMWVWELHRTERGNLDAIASRAASAGVQTVFVKSADGVRFWPQFSGPLVQALHARGLRVCAWQFLYGRRPTVEATLGARAASLGADCLVLDVEGQYAGRYAAAGAFLRSLRARVGDEYPLGFTSFPYVSWHSSVPYSVFLGPGGAQVNMPQAYWRAIGGGVDKVIARTVAENAIYGRPMAFIGQLYQRPSASEIDRFRELASVFGAPGVSFWSWQSAAPAGWAALNRPLKVPVTRPDVPPVVLKYGSKGDQVRWLQTKLVIRVTGRFDAATEDALVAFQAGHGLAPTGQTDWPTWAQLIAPASASASQRS